MRVRAAVCAALILVAMLGAVVAGPLDDANEALKRKDYANAVRLYRPLATKGDPSAQVNLGFMYDEGLGVPQDYAEAVKWYRRAADQGEPHGLSNLANMYRDGLGVPQDYIQAHLWFNLAAARFPAAEKEKREAATEHRDTVGAKMTPEQVAEAQKLAQQWQSKPESTAGWWEWLLGIFR